jgi:hypothetical protein
MLKSNGWLVGGTTSYLWPGDNYYHDDIEIKTDGDNYGTDSPGIRIYYRKKYYTYQYSRKVATNYDNGNWTDKSPSEMTGWNKTSEQTLYKYYKVGKEEYNNGNWTDKSPSEMTGWTKTNNRTLYQYSKKATKTTDWVTKNPGNDYALTDTRTVYKFYKTTGAATTPDYYSEAPIGYPTKLEDESTLTAWSNWTLTKPIEKSYRTIKNKLQMQSRKVTTSIKEDILPEYVTQTELEKTLGKTLKQIESDPVLSYSTKTMYRYRTRK